MSATEQAAGPWDSVVLNLQQLRERQKISYRRLAELATERRRASGADEFAAQVSRSTVWDQLQPGRTRPNEPLLRELAAVLGVEQATVDGWLATAGGALISEPEKLEDNNLPQDGLPTTTAVPPHTKLTTLFGLLLLVACIVLNFAGLTFVSLLELPFFLDMVGTAVAAIALGPWRGAAVGFCTNLLGALIVGWGSLPFALVNVAGALVLGYGVRSQRWASTPLRFTGLAAVMGTACTFVAVPILLALNGSIPRAKQDFITGLFFDASESFPLALFASNLSISLGDKLISCFLAFVVVASLPVAMRSSTHLFAIAADPPRHRQQ